MASRLFCWTTFLRPAWPIIVILFFVQGKVTAADIEFIGCSTIKEGATTPIVATFNASKRAGCTLSPLTTVTFRVVNQGYANDDICTQDVSTGATCDSTVKPGGCSCRSRVGDFWTFDFAFDFVPQRHENGTLLLAHGCIPSVTFTSNNCSDLKSAPPTTGPPSTTAQLGSQSCKCCEARQRRTWMCWCFNDPDLGPLCICIIIVVAAGGTAIIVVNARDKESEVIFISTKLTNDQVEKLRKKLQPANGERPPLQTIKEKVCHLCYELKIELKSFTPEACEPEGTENEFKVTICVKIRCRSLFVRLNAAFKVKKLLNELVLECQGKEKSADEIHFHSVGSSSSDTSGNKKVVKMASTKVRPLPFPANHQGDMDNSASPRLMPLQYSPNKETSGEHKSGINTRNLPFPLQQPLEPIVPGKTS